VTSEAGLSCFEFAIFIQFTHTPHTSTNIFQQLIAIPHFVSITAGLGVISNPIGALLAGFLMEIFGRKTTVKLTSLPYIIGWILISLSDDIFKLYAGRFISGVAVGRFS
jgi:MFS family permease